MATDKIKITLDLLELSQLRTEIDDLEKDTIQTQAKLSIMRRRINQILTGRNGKIITRVLEVEDRFGNKYELKSGVDLD